MRLIAILIASIAAGVAHAAPAGEAQLTRVEAREQSRPVVEGLRKAAAPRAARARAIGLERPGPELAREIGTPVRGVALKIGVARDVAALAGEDSTRQALEWETTAGGARVAALQITSPEAAAVRAALRVAKLPDAAVLRFRAPSEPTQFEMTGAELHRILDENARAGVSGEEADTYWSPVIDGDTVLVEIEIPAASDPRDVRIALPRVSHLVTSAAETFATPTTLGRSASCNVDATCSTGWSNQINAVAQMIFSDGAGSYLCTGTLLADSDTATNTPYFLTARHCIGSQTLASSLVTYWFYRSNACNSTTPRTYQQLAGGGALLYSSTNTDTAFLRLNNTPPQGTYFAGWQVSSVAGIGAATTGLHQPRGDLLKISQGGVSGYLNCTAPTDGRFSCSSGSSGASGFYAVDWSSGITEPGSSGSGLFLANGMLVGQLYGGGSACDGSGGDIYGRFDVAYNAGIRSWLSPSPPVALTVSKAGTGAGTVTSNPAGISCGSTCSASYAQGTSVTLSANAASGSTFAGWTGACSGTGACSVAMTAAKSVTATFNAVPVTLSVSKIGSGTVTSAPSGINCGSTCTASFATGSTVVLTPTPAAGAVFKGWSGACSGLGTCSVAMTSATSVTASFGAATDLAITQQASPAAARTGRDVVFAITVVNNGAAVTDVVVDDTLPAGSQFVWASPACTPGSGTVRCTAGSLPAGEGIRFLVVARRASSGTMTNTATVSSAQADSVPGNDSSTASVSVTASPAANVVQRWRLYSPVTQEHHFTTDANEYNVLGSFAGTWIQEGPSGKVLDNPGSYGGVTAVPYYRLYDNNTRWHLWTTEPNEYYTLSQFPGWTAEGIDGFVLPTQAPGTIPLFRLLYPYVAGLHHWTVDPAEYADLVAKFGWIGEGGAGFVIP